MKNIYFQIYRTMNRQCFGEIFALRYPKFPNFLDAGEACSRISAAIYATLTALPILFHLAPLF